MKTLLRRAAPALLLGASLLAAAPGGARPPEQLIDPYAFMVMDQRERDNRPDYYTTGHTRCPSGYDPEWCARGAEGADGGVLRGRTFHQTLRLAPLDGALACEQPFVVLKSRPASATEWFCADGGQVRLMREKMFDGTVRTFRGEHDEPYGIWGSRATTPRRFAVDRGRVIHELCPDGAPGPSFDVVSGWFWFGPRRISDPESRFRAAEKLAPYAAPGRDPIPIEWVRMAEAIDWRYKAAVTEPPPTDGATAPSDPASEVWIAALVSFWSPFDPERAGDDDPAVEKEHLYRYREVYVYGSIGYDSGAPIGLGLLAWTVFHHATPDEPMRALREVVQTEVRFLPPHVAVPRWGACESAPRPSRLPRLELAGNPRGLPFPW